MTHSCVNCLPCANLRPPPIPVTVREISPEIASWWDANVQPEINKDLSRADTGWFWQYITSFNEHSVPLVQRPMGLAICLQIPDTTATLPYGRPIGLVQLLRKYAYVADTAFHCIHVQFLSTIPRQLLPAPYEARLTGQALVDIAIVQSLLHNYQGRVSSTVVKDLRRLTHWHTSSCGMHFCQEVSTPGTHWFAHDLGTARRAYDKLKSFRSECIK